MTKSVAKLLFSVAFFIFLPALQALGFDEFRTTEAGQWDLEADFNYYNATANYSRDGGEYESLPGGFAYKLMEFDFGARWTPSNKWGFFTQARYGYAASDDGVTSRTNGAFSHLKFGADLQMGRFASFDLMPEFSLLFPMSRVSPSEDKVLVGEGAMELDARLIAKTQWSFLQPMAFVGITYRDEGRSTLLPYGFGAEVAFSSMALGAELRGYQSIIDDEKTDEPLTKEGVRFKNGGALKFYSVNPSLLETNLWLRFNKSGRYQFKIGGGTSITGSSMAAGWSVFTTLNYQFETTARSSYDSAPPQPDPAIEFREETHDGVDQNIFRLPPPPTPPKPKPTPNPRLQKKKLQKELDQTEMMIELRSNKKKPKSR